MSTSQTPPASTTSDPSREPLQQPLPFAAPTALQRERNGATGPGDPLSIDALRDHTGGGRASNPFIPEWCRNSGK
jgi:hypothetical protein